MERGEDQRVMNRVDTGPLRQLYDQLGIEQNFVMPSRAAWQLQGGGPQAELPAALATSIEKLRDLAAMSGDYLQMGALEFSIGLDFLHGGRSHAAVRYFETAQRKWLFCEHLPLLSLAHLAAGMAYQASGEHRQAAAAYFKAKRCLHQAETEPHLLEKIEAERSLQAFWNDLERWLMLAIRSLQRDFTQEQDEFLRAELGDVPGDQDDMTKHEEDQQKGLTTLSLRMQSAEIMSATEFDLLVVQTVSDIELLNKALTPTGAGLNRPQPSMKRLKYADSEQITIELSNVSTHAVAFCRWLMTTIPNDMPRDEEVPEGDEASRAWFRWRQPSGHFARLVRVFVKSVTGKEPSDADVDLLMQVISHLAELRLNCRLTVK
jgi:tetratricopeptide (TPR) repeat protein